MVNFSHDVHIFLTISRFHDFTLSRFHAFHDSTIPRFHDSTISRFHAFTIPRFFTISRFHDSTISRFHNLVENFQFSTKFIKHLIISQILTELADIGVFVNNEHLNIGYLCIIFHHFCCNRERET